MLTKSHSRARAILRDFRPDLVVGTGGYASYPMVKAAARAHLPTAVHESNMVPGLTTKLLGMPEEVRGKFRGTLTRIVNEGATGLICLIL